MSANETGIFIRMMEGLSGTQTERHTVMIDATCLKTHRTASSLRKRAKKNDLNLKIVCDESD